MNTQKLLTGVIAWCCLLWSIPAAGQQLDSTAVRTMTQNKPFPYPVGVAMTWRLYQLVRLNGQQADSLVVDQSRLIAGLRYQLHEGELLYGAAAKRADDAQRAADRKTVVIDQLQASLVKARRQSSRPLLLRPQTWTVGGVCFGAGLVVGAGIILSKVGK